MLLRNVTGLGELLQYSTPLGAEQVVDHTGFRKVRRKGRITFRLARTIAHFGLTYGAERTQGPRGRGWGGLELALGSDGVGLKQCAIATYKRTPTICVVQRGTCLHFSPGATTSVVQRGTCLPHHPPCQVSFAKKCAGGTHLCGIQMPANRRPVQGGSQTPIYAVNGRSCLQKVLDNAHMISAGSP